MILGYAAVDSSVFVLQGFIQNVPPLLAANGRCACLCINQGAVNLPFHRRGSQAGNYFWICKSADRRREKDTEQGSGHRSSTKADMKRWSNFFYRICLILWFLCLLPLSKKKKNQKKASNWLFCDLLWHFSENVFGVVWIFCFTYSFMAFLILYISVKMFTAVDGWLLQAFHLYGDISGTVSHIVHSSLIFLFSSL